MVLDTSVGDHTLYTAGANEIDLHYRNVVSGRDFKINEFVDISEVHHGDRCAQCQEGILEIRRGIELGHTFKLGTKYTDPNSMDVTYLNAAGEQQRIIMGCYGIGVERLMASAVEQWHDDAGIIWPITIAPFQVMLTALGQKGEVAATAEKLYEELRRHCEVLYDDRTESAGVKFKDADLLGIPIRVLISPKLNQKGDVEIKLRKTGEVLFCSQNDLIPTLENLVASLQPSLDGLLYMPEV
jgi:prolyl-tRNA synthetase